MTYGLSDFDLRSVPTPRLRIGGGPTRTFPRTHSSVLGLAVDNLVKWLVWAQASRAVSFDWFDQGVCVRSVRKRLLYPRHLRYAGRWLDRLGIARWSEEEPARPRPDHDEISRRKADWEHRWFEEVAKQIVAPLLRGRLHEIADETLGRYLTEFIWSPRLRDVPRVLPGAVESLREIMSRVELRRLASTQAIIDANFGLAPGDHYVLSAIEPDVVLDATLVDIKLSAQVEVSRRVFEDMVRYYLCFALHEFFEERGAQMHLWRRVPSRVQVERLGLFVADRAELITWDRREWLSDAKLTELRRMYADGTWAYAKRHQPKASPQLALFGPSRRRRRPRRI